MKCLITGGCGFIGTNLAMATYNKGYEVIVLDNLSRKGAKENMNWLRNRTNVIFEVADIRDQQAIERIIIDYRPDVIFHLAAQVAMTTSIENPRIDFEINALGTLNILEATRKHTPNTTIIYSSTNKVYGNLAYIDFVESETRYFAPAYPNGFNEELKLDFHSPYGCSKGAADQYMLDYSRIFGLKTIVLRLSSIYGERQFSTYDQGWVGWFIKEALRSRKGEIDEFTVAGNGKQVRDLLHVDDAICCFFAAVEKIDEARGEAFNIGGGAKNSLSIIELLHLLEKKWIVS